MTETITDLFSRCSKMVTKVLTYTSSLHLYYPTSEKKLSCIVLPDGKSIYISDANSASDATMLRDHGIKSVVSIRTPYIIMSPVYAAIDANEEVNKLVLYFSDHVTTDITAYITLVNEFIDNSFFNNASPLIHCSAGKSRSVSLLIAYIILTYNITFQEAYDMVHTVRPEIEINDGFKHKLMLVEKINSNKSI